MSALAVAALVASVATDPAQIIMRNEQGMECKVQITEQGQLLSSCPVAAPSLNVASLEDRIARIEATLKLHNEVEGFVPPPDPPVAPSPQAPPTPPQPPASPSLLKWTNRAGAKPWNWQDTQPWAMTDNSKTATASSGNTRYGVVTAGAARSSGKWYLEIRTNTGGNNGIAIGLSNLGADQAGIVDHNKDVVWYWTASPSLCCQARPSYGAVVQQDDVIGIAYDADGCKLQFYVNGVSQGDANLGVNLCDGAFSVAAMDFTSQPNAASLTVLDTPEYPMPSGYAYWPAA